MLDACKTRACVGLNPRDACVFSDPSSLKRKKPGSGTPKQKDQQVQHGSAAVDEGHHNLCYVHFCHVGYGAMCTRVPASQLRPHILI